MKGLRRAGRRVRAGRLTPGGELAAFGPPLAAAVAVALLLGSYALLGLAPDLPLLGLAFCGTFVVYQAERAWGAAPEDSFTHPGRLAWIRRHRGYIWGSTLAAGALALVLASTLRPATLLWCAALGACSTAYGFPVLPGGRRLKTVWFAKPLLIASAWAVGAVVVPTVEAGMSLTPAGAALVAYRFLYILPNALMADWLDRAGDARAGLRTAGTVLSPHRLRSLAAATALLAGAAAVVAGLLVQPLLLVDAAGAFVLAWAAVRAGGGERALLCIDAIVAWPAVTALVAAFAG